MSNRALLGFTEFYRVLPGHTVLPFQAIDSNENVDNILNNNNQQPTTTTNIQQPTTNNEQPKTTKKTTIN